MSEWHDHYNTTRKLGPGAVRQKEKSKNTSKYYATIDPQTRRGDGDKWTSETDHVDHWTVCSVRGLNCVRFKFC